MYIRINDNYFCHNTGAGNNSKCKIFGGKIEFVHRQIVKDPVSVQVAAASKDVSSTGPDVGATYSGPICLRSDLSSAKVQLCIWTQTQRQWMPSVKDGGEKTIL